MPIGTDYRQAIILAVENQGEQAVNSLKASLKVVQEQIEGWNRALEAGTTSTTTHIAAVAKLVQVQGDLKAAIEVTREAEGKAQRERIEGYARAERAAKESADAEKQAAGDAMRARIDGYARAERAREDADRKRKASLDEQIQDEAKLQAALGAMEARSNAERGQEAARRAMEQREIDIRAMGDRARMYAKSEAEIEQAEQRRMDRKQKLADVAMAMSVAEQRGYKATATAMASASGNLGGYATQSEVATAATKRGSYAMLNLAHAIQDAQYGFGAVLNNIPLVVQAMGGSGGLAGTIMIAGVAINTVMPHMEEFGKKIGVLRDPLKDAIDGLEGMKEKLEALESKPFKVPVDFASIRALRIEIRETQKAISEWEAQKNRDSKDKRAAKDVIAEGINEGGGAQSFENAIVAIQKRQGTFGAGSELHGQIAWQRNAMGVAQRGIKAMGGEDAALAQPFVLARDHARSQVAALQDQLETEGRNKVAGMVGLKFGEGSRKTLEDMLLNPANQDILQQHGVTNQAKLGVVMASPWNMMAGGKDAAAQELERDNAREAKKREEHRKQVQQTAENEQKQVERETRARDKAAVDLNYQLAVEESRQINAGEKGAARAAAKTARENAAAAKATARDAPRIAAHARDMGFAQEFQRVTGADDVQANYAGQQVGNLVEKGANPAQAMQQVFQKMMRELTEMKANEEAMLGMIGPATIQLQQMNQQNAAFRQRIGAVQGNQRRMGNQRPTRGIPFN